MSKMLIIDDSDAGITYTGNWVSLTSVGIDTREFNATVHQSGAAGDQLSYTFEGTGITVYGTLDAPGTHGSPGPTFSIDGQTPTGFNSNTIVGLSQDAISSYVPLYKSPTLTKGTHTITISSGTAANTSTHLYVDFLLIETGQGSGYGNIIVDDRDTSITYVGTWRDGGGPWEFGLTTKYLDDVAGGTATFRFNGTSLTIYGTTPSSSGANTTAAISFTVDGGTSTRFDSPQNAQVIQHNTLFRVEGLSNSQEHSVVMTNLNTNKWWLDFIVYTTHNSSIAGGGATGPVTSDGGVVGGITGGGSSGGPNVGAIAGGVVAGVTGLLAIAGIIFLLLRRRKLKSHKMSHDKSVTVGIESQFDSSFQPSPFTPPVMGQHAHANPLPNKRYDLNTSSGTLTGGTGDRIGRALLESTATSSYLEAQSPLSSLPPGRSQYSDSESQHVLSPAVAGPGPGYEHQSFNNPLPSRLDPAAGGVASMYQRDSRQDYGQAPGNLGGQKALYTHGLPVVPTIPAVVRSPPSSVQTIEEDSGVRIPTRAPPVYTAD